MSLKNKFKIKGLEKKQKYSDAAEIIVDSKLREINKRVDRYFKNDSLDNLHVTRLAFRRFRYALELFYDCIEPKLFKRIYLYSKQIHDLLGQARDLDVLEQKFRLAETEINQKLPESLYEKINIDKDKIRHQVKIELINFIADEDINKFLLN
jgi:CHAD domain-containing protein